MRTPTSWCRNRSPNLARFWFSQAFKECPWPGQRYCWSCRRRDFAGSSRAVRGQLAAVVHRGVGSSTGCPHGQPHQTHTVSRLVAHRQSGAQWKTWPALCSPAPESSVLRTIVGIARRCDNLIVGGSNVSAGAPRWSSGRITAARSRADCSQQSRCGWLKPSSRDE